MDDSLSSREQSSPAGIATFAMADIGDGDRVVFLVKEFSAVIERLATLMVIATRLASFGRTGWR
jgi:hypothetical protein